MILGLALPVIALRGVERCRHSLKDVCAMPQCVRNVQQFVVRNFDFHGVHLSDRPRRKALRALDLMHVTSQRGCEALPGCGAPTIFRRCRAGAAWPLGFYGSSGRRIGPLDVKRRPTLPDDVATVRPMTSETRQPTSRRSRNAKRHSRLSKQRARRRPSSKGRTRMCDYSLHVVSTRPAKVGDRLISARFPGTDTRGFATAEEPNVAVCL